MERVKVAHLVKSEELNHHGTLFAGRIAEWFVEACFIQGAQVTQKPDNIVCLNIHGLHFKTPGHRGDIIHIDTQMVKAGRTSFAVYGKVTKNNETSILADGFITFVFVDENGKPIPHNIVLDPPVTEEETHLRKIAKTLK